MVAVEATVAVAVHSMSIQLHPDYIRVLVAPVVVVVVVDDVQVVAM